MSGDDWMAQVRAGVGEMFADRLGPAIVADAKTFVPVDTGRLMNAIDHQVLDEDGAPLELQVGVFPDAEGPVEYAAAVELGFHGEEHVRAYVNHDFMGTGRAVEIRAHTRHGNSPEQPYLRPALYQERGE